MNDRLPDYDETPLFSRRERWHLDRLPMFGFFVGGFIGIVAAFVFAGGHVAAVVFLAIVVAALGAICGLIKAVGIVATRTSKTSARGAVHGCLIAGVLGGAIIGGFLGTALASTGPFDANKGNCGTLAGAIIGLWLGVTIDLFGSYQTQPGRELRIDRPLLLKLLLVIGLTVVVIRVLLSWRFLGDAGT